MGKAQGLGCGCGKYLMTSVGVVVGEFGFATADWAGLIARIIMGRQKRSGKPCDVAVAHIGVWHVLNTVTSCSEAFARERF